MKRRSAKTYQLKTLFDIIRAVNSSLDLDEVLHAILHSALDVFKGQAGSIMLINESQELTIAAAMGLPPEIVESTRIRIGEGIAGWVAQTGEPLLLDGKVRNGGFRNLVDRKERISSSLCAPLNARGKIIGVAMIRKASSLRFTEEQMEFFGTICDQVSIALENARLFEAERRKAEELALLNRSMMFEKGKIEAVLASMADGVLVTDASGNVILLNVVAGYVLDRLGREPESLHFSDLFENPGFDVVCKAVIEEGIVYSWEYSPPGCKDLYFNVLASAILAADEGSADDGSPLAAPPACGLAEAPDSLFSDTAIEGIVFVLRNVSDEKRLDRMKTQFLSMVSHELKTPLTSIQGFVELMLFKDYPEERRRQFLKISLDECHRLMRLFDNLLTLSRLEAGQFQFHKETISLDTLVGYLVGNFKVQYLSHSFEVVVSGKTRPVHADPDMIAQVVTNLLSNAVKYSPKGGTVEVTVTCLEDQVQVAVADEGIGIPQDKLPFVFEKFFRVDSTLTRETGGAGLGLANVRYIVEGHDGKLWVESRLGEGSVFTFTLPALADDNLK